MKVKIVDSTFSHNATIGLCGENMGQQPKHFQWDFEPGEADIKFFTDLRLQEAKDDRARKKIALLIEPFSLTMQAYREAAHLMISGVLDTVLSHNDSASTPRGRDYRFYPFGGSWLKEWAIHPKTPLVSILVSDKTKTDGHRLRHQVVEDFPNLHIYGQPYTEYLPTKSIALRDFCYSIVIENVQDPCFFTEKLIDCLSQGTIPIYWGPDVSNYFDMNSIPSFSTLDELANILAKINVEDYNSRMEAITSNLKLAERYRCPEDWIFEHYPDLFEV